MADAAYLVVGLGNPGDRYAGNRHNVGFMVADLLAERVGGHGGSGQAAAWSAQRRARAQVCIGRLAVGGPQVVLAKPMTYMNLSGESVRALASFYKITPDHVVVVHDDMDLPYGTLRLKSGGGEGGHNGLRSISQHLGTQDYLRVRFGVGRPPGRMDGKSYVLKDFGSAERADLALFVDRAADATEDLVTGGLAAAQNRFHALS